ncbi:MAG: hypothetical protein JWR18_3399 [Segetibacter sp.]|nr:hypothetical protein [Segetibacter sp.]
MYPGWELNPHSRCGEQDFKSCVSTSSTTRVYQKNPVLPSEGRDFLERKTGLEPATPTLARSCSTK